MKILLISDIDKTVTVTRHPQLQANTAWNESLHNSLRKQVSLALTCWTLARTFAQHQQFAVCCQLWVFSCLDCHNVLLPLWPCYQSSFCRGSFAPLLLCRGQVALLPWRPCCLDGLAALTTLLPWRPWRPCCLDGLAALTAVLPWRPCCLDGRSWFCRFEFEKTKTELFIFRLDFEQFTTLGPADTEETTGGACQDTFMVTVRAN